MNKKILKSKYPVYILSKGRWENPMTAKLFIKDGVDFLILVEPQEYDNYCSTIPKKYIHQLPFSNLGVGGYPARNYAWEHSMQNGHKRHWIFDDNIGNTRMLKGGKKVYVNTLSAIQGIEDFTDRYSNVGISGFNYSNYVVGSSCRKPFYINVHVYSCMLIKNNMPYRWRLKYNEDIDLCLQVLENKYCTILVNQFMMDKTSTVAKMKGGNQDDLYKGNAHEKKVLKARSLQEMWPQYVKVVMKYGRPHHQVSWHKFFKHPLKRSTKVEIDKTKSYNKLKSKTRSKK